MINQNHSPNRLALVFRAYADGLQKADAGLQYSTSFANFFREGFYLEYLPRVPAPACPGEPRPGEPAEAPSIRQQLARLLRERFCPKRGDRLAEELFLQRLPDGSLLAHVTAALKDALLLANPRQTCKELPAFWADQDLEAYASS